MIEFISQPWHWSISGALIVVVMYLLLLFGGEFGVSANLRTICAMVGAGKNCSFFNFNWKKDIWNLVFLTGAIIGGFIAVTFLTSPEPVQVSDATISLMTSMGINTPIDISEGYGYLPSEIFGEPFKPVNLLILIGGGLMVGFGSRYAGGCTSGHAISGLSNLQLPSLIAVIGFFIGGLFMSWVLLPILLTL